MKSKSHFFHDLDLSSILEPADPNDKNYSATKVNFCEGAARHSKPAAGVGLPVELVQLPDLAWMVPAGSKAHHAAIDYV